ncbi:hypothetical protein D9M72_647940 [compost metagenome]
MTAYVILGCIHHRLGTRPHSGNGLPGLLELDANLLAQGFAFFANQAGTVLEQLFRIFDQGLQFAEGLILDLIIEGLRSSFTGHCVLLVIVAS